MPKFVNIFLSIFLIYCYRYPDFYHHNHECNIIVIHTFIIINTLLYVISFEGKRPNSGYA